MLCLIRIILRDQRVICLTALATRSRHPVTQCMAYAWSIPVAIKPHMQQRWHTLSIEAVCEALRVDAQQGLAAAEAARRLRTQGANRLLQARPPQLLGMLARQFSDFMILVLIAAALVSALFGELVDSIAILVIILLNALIGVVQEYRAERALQALAQLAVPTVRVRRDAHTLSIPSYALVPGDILLLEAGDLVAADVRLAEVAALQLNEAALTGESVPVSKQADDLPDSGQAVAERSNMAFRGTQVTYGRAEGVVVATGMATEIGRIAELLEQGRRPATPLQLRLARFGRRLALLVLAVCAIVFATGLMRGVDPLLMFLTAVSLAVAAIPEALPAVIAIALALGARRLVRQQALIRRLPAVETLGSVTVICSDKTGTLTQNRMHAELLQLGEQRLSLDEAAKDETAQLLLHGMALNNDCSFGSDGEIAGEPTEAALLQAVQDAGLDALRIREQASRIAELPFDSQRKLMSTLHQLPDRARLITKGAPEQLLARCTANAFDRDAQDFDPEEILEQAVQLAGEGYRVLAFALREWPQPPQVTDSEQLENELHFIGLVALIDPPRPEVQQAVETCRGAGIRPVMITGDHPATARAIARQLGIAGEHDRLITGQELAELSDAELGRRVADTPVYARVAPEQKIRIVKALQQRGEFVAMTGDGVNDAPALRHANIGVAMGRVGTDVAREASDMVLLDDNFASIVGAIGEARRIYDNIRKFIRYTMTSNSGEIWTLFLAPLLGLPLPLLPIHILWINLVTDGLPGLALTREPREAGLMQRPPRPPGESVFAHGMGWHMLWIGLLIGALSIGTQAWAVQAGNPHWQTMVFNVLTFAQLFNVLAIRSEHQSLFTLGLLSNRTLLGAVLATFLLQLAVTYVPLLQQLCHTDSLSVAEMLICLLVASLVLPAVELEKWLVRRGLLYVESDAMRK